METTMIYWGDIRVILTTITDNNRNNYKKACLGEAAAVGAQAAAVGAAVGLGHRI